MTPNPAAQWQMHLDLANQVRVAHKAERDRLAGMLFEDAAERVAEILDRPDHVTGRMRVGHLLTAVQGIGRDRLEALLIEAGVLSADKRVADLHPTARGRLAWAVIGWSDRRLAGGAAHRRYDRRGKATA